MKLSRESKTGKMKNNNFGKAVAAISLTIGLVCVSKSMIDLNLEKQSVELDHYASYAEQVESVYGIDINSEKKEEILNSMAFNLDLVNQYNATDDSSKKQSLINQIYNTKGMLRGSALSLIKLDAALEEGRSIDDYAIRPGTDSEWEVYREENGVTQYFSPLNRSARRLVNTAEDLASVSREDTSEFLKLYEDTVKQSAAYVGKTIQDKAK